MAAKELIQTITVGAGGAASIEFTGIPATGTDLLILFSSRMSAGTFELLQFNADTSSSNYFYTNLLGDGSAASSGQGSPTNGIYFYGEKSTYTSSSFDSSSIYIPNYTASTAKSISIDNVTENNATGSLQNIVAGKWSGTAAISSIKITAYSVNTFTQYSTASLYKITKGSGGASVA